MVKPREYFSVGYLYTAFEGGIWQLDINDGLLSAL